MRLSARLENEPIPLSGEDQRRHTEDGVFFTPEL